MLSEASRPLEVVKREGEGAGLVLAAIASSYEMTTGLWVLRGLCLVLEELT
mgnify:CR=1 FL=1